MEASNMELNELKDITSSYKERMRRLALFDPLFELERKKIKDFKGTPIDMKGLGLLSLLFFFEQKLMRNNRVGTKDLARFLQRLTENTYQLDGLICEELASSIIQTFRPASGKKRAYAFYNWENNENEVLEYSLLKANSFDSKTNTQYYTLDEDGLELIFATKEFYNEFQLSINQLMLRKQLEKGEFRGALRQLNEMRIDVESLRERMIKLRHEIQRSIVSEDTFLRYKQLLEDIHLRLMRENEEFEELRQFVKETKDRLYEKDYHKKEQKTYAYVIEITNQLEEVHYEHTGLLEESIDLKNHTLKAAQESLYYTGIDAFNFDQDINARIIAGPLPMETMKGVLHPFLKVLQEEWWSPLTVFADQNIKDEREERNDYAFMKIGNAEDDDYQKILRKNYGYVMKVSLEAIEEGCTDLLSIIHYIKQYHEEALLEQRFFYDFWIILHQRSPIISGEMATDEEEKNHSMDEALAKLGNRTLHVMERHDVIEVNKRFSIQNMDIFIEEDHGDEL
jgi:hypothetical protein